jgi:acyl carrier protein
MPAMNIENIINEIVFKVVKKHGIAKKLITPEKLITDDLKADSLDVIEMMLEFQEKFNLSISEEDVSEIRSIGDIYRYVIYRMETEKA